MAASTYIPFGGLRCTVWMMFGRSEENPIFSCSKSSFFLDACYSVSFSERRKSESSHLNTGCYCHIWLCEFWLINMCLPRKFSHIPLVSFCHRVFDGPAGPIATRGWENIDGTKCPKIAFVPGRYLDKRQPFRLGIIVSCYSLPRASQLGKQNTVILPAFLRVIGLLS